MKIIYNLNGICQVGNKILDTKDGIIVECLTTLVEPKYHTIIDNYRLDENYEGITKVVTTLEEINDYYDRRIRERLEENRIDESRRIRAKEYFYQYLK